MAERINDRRIESTYPTESEPPHEREAKPSAPSRDPATAYARMPGPTGYAAELARYVETHTPRQATSEKTAGPSGARGKSSAESKAMDGVRDRFAGPYVVDGKTVSARPMFRMNVPDAFNARSLKEHLPTLRTICKAKGLEVAMQNCIAGRPTPEELQKVTQALVNAGELDAGPVEENIRKMQWRFGIGVDCAGYVMEAMKVAHPKVAIGPSERMGDMFSGMNRNPRFVDVGVINARPGDVIHLRPEKGGVPHNAMVRSHDTVGAHNRSELQVRLGAASIPALKEGVHVIELDSSWGAEDGRDFGGFRRDTFLFDPSAKPGEQWSYWSPKNQTFLHGVVGPQGEEVKGCFRPKEKL